MRWKRALTNDANWIDGCFEWYRRPGDPIGSSTNVYWNSRPGATTGRVGGHKICVPALMASQAVVAPKIVGGVPVDPARKYMPAPPSRANAALRSPPAAVC